MFLRDKEILMAANQDNEYLNLLLHSEEVIKFIKSAIKAYTKSPSKFMAVNKVEWDDLLQAAYLGLFKAIRNMDFELSPNEWVRYAYLSVQGELRNFSRSNDSNMIVISQRIRELYPKYKKFHEDFWFQYAKDPTIEDTMKHFNISNDDAFDLVYGMQEVLYYESRRNEDDTRTSGMSGIVEFNQSTKTLSVEDQVINNILVEEALSYANETQYKIIHLHYFKDLTKSEISNIIGCSNSMVHKHISTLFKSIRKTQVAYP